MIGRGAAPITRICLTACSTQAGPLATIHELGTRPSPRPILTGATLPSRLVGGRVFINEGNEVFSMSMTSASGLPLPTLVKTVKAHVDAGERE